MSETNHLCDIWEHTIVRVFKHNSKSDLGPMLKQWIIFNKLDNLNSILNYTVDDFIPSGNLSYLNKHGEILHQTPLKEDFNLRWCIQHLMDENEDEDENSLNRENWMKQTNWKFIKYVIHHKHSMIPEQLKQKHFKETFNIQQEKLDTEEGESNEEEEESTTSSVKSEQDSESDTSTEDEQETDTTETLQVHHGMNEMTHDEENPSEAEDDTSEENSLHEMEHLVNGGQNEQESKLLTTNFEGLITYSTDQHIFKFMVNSGTDQEVWGVNIDF